MCTGVFFRGIRCVQDRLGRNVALPGRYTPPIRSWATRVAGRLRLQEFAFIVSGEPGTAEVNKHADDLIRFSGE